MVKGIHLTLMIGPAVPVPVSPEVLDALAAVQVTSSADGPSGFQLTFNLSPRSPLHTLFLLSGGVVPPIMRVLILATVNGMPEVLMDGVMTHHEMAPAGGAGPATLTVTGEDLRRVMDYIELTGVPYPAMPAEARVAVILAKYAFLGVVPLVVPSVLTSVPLPVERIPVQEGTDLAYVESLAAAVGHVFYVEPGPAPGMSLAYWGPDIRVGLPQPALNVDMDAHTNVESMNFRFDSESATRPVLWIQERTTRVPIPIPVPDLSPLRPPLGLVPPLPKKIRQVTEMAKASPVEAALAGLAEAALASDAVTASGTLDVLRYGRILKARRLVGVRGAGIAYDGLYYVKSVTHEIKRGEYKQAFTLVRNGLLPTVPVVPP